MQNIVKRLMGAKWETHDTLKITYIKPVLKCGSEVIAMANKVNLDQLETSQNNAVRLICVAVKTTPTIHRKAAN